MDLTPELLIAVNVLFTGIVVALVQLYNSRRTAIKEDNDSKRLARKDEVESLRAEVTRLSQQVEDMSKRNSELRTDNDSLHEDIIYIKQENAWLRQVLMIHQIEVPPMPAQFVQERTMVAKGKT